MGDIFIYSSNSFGYIINTEIHLVFPVAAQKVPSYMGRQNVLQQNPIEVLHGFDLFTLPFELVPPQEVQPTVIFILLQEDTETLVSFTRSTQCQRYRRNLRQNQGARRLLM